jgi:hypothetical protein
VYKYVTVSVDTSSLENWLKSMKRNETQVLGYNYNGVVAGAKVVSYKTVTWKVPRSSVEAGPA